MRIVAVLLAAMLLVAAGSPHPEASMTRSERLRLREQVRSMFTFAWDSYHKYAFPLDELDPVHCTGRGSDKADRNNININDVLGDYSLTLIDAMDTLAVMGNTTEFIRSVDLYIKTVPSYNIDATVSIFEVTIRVMGGLLSAHTIIKDEAFGVKMPWYKDQLLGLAHDLGERLLPAFRTPTGIPFPRIHLQRGVAHDVITEACTAGAGTLLLEFSTLSRLTGDPRFERVARAAIGAIWKRRSSIGLPGNVINVFTGIWSQADSGVGAGIDSYYEYLFKGHILLGDQDLLHMAETAYDAIKQHIMYEGNRVGPYLRHVHMDSGQPMTTWIDALSAYFPGLQVLMGDLDGAVASYEVYYLLWQLFGALPERFDVTMKRPNIPLYPLRPELMESTWMLYRSTGDPHYLHAGARVLRDLNLFTRTRCGFAAIHNIVERTHENRMESFFLSETLKYLFLLFDEENILNTKEGIPYVLTTEGHVLKTQGHVRGEGKGGHVRGGRRMCARWEGGREVHQYDHVVAARNAVLMNTMYDVTSLDALVMTSPLGAVFPAMCDAPPAHNHDANWGANSGANSGSTRAPARMEVVIAAPEQAESGVNAADSFPVVSRDAKGALISSQLHNLRLTLVKQVPWPDGSHDQGFNIVAFNGIFLKTSIDVLKVMVRPPPEIETKVTRPRLCVAVQARHVIGQAPKNVSRVVSLLHLSGLSAAFGPPAHEITWPISAPLRTTAWTACQGDDHVTDQLVSFSGAVVVIERGACDFVEKVRLATQAGALFVIVVNTGRRHRPATTAYEFAVCDDGACEYSYEYFASPEEMEDEEEVFPMGMVETDLKLLRGLAPSMMVSASSGQSLLMSGPRASQCPAPIGYEDDDLIATVWPCHEKEAIENMKKWQPTMVVHVDGMIVRNLRFERTPLLF